MDENPSSAGPSWPPPTVESAGTPPYRESSGGRWRPRWAVWLSLGILVLVLVFIVVATQVTVNDYLITPGVAQPVGPLVKVPADKSHALHGSILLTDVYLSTRLTLWNWITAQFNSDAAIVPATELVSSSSQPTQLLEQGYITMARAQQSAKVAALTRLGYQLSPTDVGVMVTGVAARSAATGRLAVGQTITGVAGTPTPTACGFEQAVATYPVGASVQLTVERTTVTSDAVVKPGPSTSVTLHLGHWPADIEKPTTTPSTCPGIAVASRGYIGIQVDQSVNYTFPFPVTISTKTIGGPSAGLAMTLTIIDKLSGGHLTGGNKVAVTGTVAATGAVGRVGGVPQKTVAVEQAGATAFIVPATTVATAQSKDIPSLRIYGVRSLSQALSVLHKLGGTIPPSSGS